MGIKLFKNRFIHLMKDYITVIITIVFLICPSICFSSYLIKLKNGSAFITNHYWKEGQQIKFYYSGGVVGVEKGMIREIMESDLPYIVEESQPAKKEKSQAEAEYKPEMEHEKETRLPHHPEKEAFLEEKKRISTEIETVSTAFSEAKAKKDSEQKNKQWNKLLLLHKELSALRNQVKIAHGEQIPFWWNKDNEI